MLIREYGGYDSTSEMEYEVVTEDALEEEHMYCDFEQGASVVVTKVLSVQIKETENG